ncbi:MAG: 16S rRNA (guanine(966)-N(2))-methyltransferase RsmD [Bryobacteraceae bacterium]
MRVIGGQFRSRRLKTLAGEALRPTPDRLREALFNILAPEIEGAVFLDAYAGSGAVGIEALSRGAARAIFIEADRAAIRVLRENLAALGLNEDRAEVIHGQVLKRLPGQRADIVFLDPPYALSREYQPALELLAENPPRLVIVQHHRRHELASRYGCLRRVRQLRQGDNALSFYRPLAGE